MAADSDGTLTAVVICEGNLHDPEFPKKFRVLLGKLKTILQQPKSKKLKVNKVEPWNSVRVTLSIPKDAAARLRQLAAEGSSALRALGILSVQLEGDTVISLRLVGQEIVLRTDNNPAGCAQEAGPSSGLGGLSRIFANPLQTATTSCPTLPAASAQNLMPEPIAGPSHLVPQSPSTNSISPALVNGPNFDKPPIFKSPNTICPMDGKLPVPPITNVAETREYPFESMTQARVIQRRENTMAVAAALGQAQPPLPTQITPVPSSSQVVVGGSNHGIIIGPPPQVSQTQQPPPPLVIPSKPLVASPQQPLPQEQTVKSQFVQPPPPPYPSVASNSTKSSLSVQHQGNAITLPVNASLSSNTNNIAISSPLLVNLLQNDGVNQVKQHQPTVVAQKPTPVVIQSQQQQPPSMQSQLHQAIVSNIKSPQQADILLNPAGHHTQGDGVLVQGGQIIVNNSGVVNPSNISTNISLNPSMPVPSSLTISNISTLNTNQPSPHNTAPSPAAMGGQSPAIVNQNMVASAPPNINIRMQQLQQQTQQRFGPQPQQQLLLRQQQIIQPGGTAIQRFPQQNPPQPPQQIINPVSQQQFRHPVQQTSPQPQQQYVTPPPSPHPNVLTANHTNITIQTNAPPISHQSQQPQQQQILGINYNHPRWPIKPMDSATKSSFQEFTRYQMQYNLQQQMNQSSLSTSSAAASSSDKQNLDPLGLVGLSDLDELTKNDLDSLLPSLNVSDLDSALGLDCKNALESLLDAKDLDLDLIDQDIPNLGATSLLDTTFDQPSQNNNCSAEDNSVFPGIEPSLTSSGKQRQYLINPLTGELEPMPSEESESEPEQENVDAFNEFNSEVSNSLYSDDENSCSTAFSKASDHSDTERSSNSEASVRSRYTKMRKERKDLSGGPGSGSINKKAKLGLKGVLLREKLQQGIKDKISGKTKQPREKTSKAKLIATTTESKDSPAEKIKLRLKLEKSEPVTPAYKVDISFVQSPKRAQTAVSTSTSMPSSFPTLSSTTLAVTPNSSPTSAQQQTNSLQVATSHQQSPAGEELRVPPLHISLRGKNSIVIKNSKKDRKKSQSGGEEDDNYFKKSQLKRNHSSFEDQANIRSLSQTDDTSAIKNSHYPHLVSKMLSQGKPATRQSNEEYHNKLIQPPVSNQVVENGDDLEGSGATKVNQSSKRNASEITQSPNGLICPEIKRRRMSQTAFEQLSQQPQESIIETDAYTHLKGPIGSTNVGTLPQHSNLSKNQKCSNNNNNSTSYSTKSGKSMKSGKPLVVVKSCKSPPSNAVKDPGKSPPMNASTSPSSSSHHPLVASITIGKTDSVENSMGSANKVTCLLPQGSSDAISEEKFKQKLLEIKCMENSESGSILNTSTSSSQISEQRSIHLPCKTSSTEALSLATPLEPVVSVNLLSSSTSTNSIKDLGNSVKVDNLKEVENSTSHGIRPPEDPARQTLCSQAQEIACSASACGVKPSTSDVGSQSTINTLTNSGNNIVRNSPGSQAQGEDSGIESMDALSEKSPHQSASPQQGDSQKQSGTMQSSKIITEEKPTLIDSKDIIVEEITSIGDIEAALAKMEGINEHFLTPCESPSQKFNGDLAMKEECLLQNLTDEKIVFCASKIEHQDLADIMLGVDEKPQLECRDLNENKEISSKASLEAQLVDECCKNTVKLSTKFENDTSVAVRRGSEVKCEKSVFESTEGDEVKLEEGRRDSAKNDSNELVLDGSKSAENLTNKEIMAPITIDIPVQAETDAHRVRTRASSKLESPLDLPRQSPQLDSPASNIKSNLRMSSTSVDRLSPKMTTGKGISGGGKRKRQGSESSTQSCVSDDTPGKGGGANNSSKRSRQNNVSGGNGESVNNNLTKTASNNTKRGSSVESYGSGKSHQSRTKKNDESSDSDEPLIEVAGKVRNSKNPVKSGSAEAEKVLRNHRVSQIKTASNSTMTATNNASPNSSKTVRNTLSSSSTLMSSTHNSGNASIPSAAVNSHSTRGSNQVNNPLDDKIGTRRSVRASAAANKIIYSKTSITETPKNAASKLNTSTVGDVTDVRRKTRSAAGNETSTEGRRRRGSRDSK